MTNEIASSFEAETIEANRAVLDRDEYAALVDFLHALVNDQIDQGNLPPDGSGSEGAVSLAVLAFSAGRAYQMQQMEAEMDHIGEDGLVYIGLSPKAVRVLLNRELEAYE